MPLTVVTQNMFVYFDVTDARTVEGSLSVLCMFTRLIDYNMRKKIVFTLLLLEMSLSGHRKLGGIFSTCNHLDWTEKEMCTRC